MKAQPLTDGRIGLGVFPASGNPPGGLTPYLPVTPAQLRANLTRFLTLSGRKPAVSVLYQVGYDPRGTLHFPADLCRVCWEEFEVIPLVIQMVAWDYGWLRTGFPDFTLEGINAGQADAVLTREATRCQREYGGPVIISPGWEDPNLADPNNPDDGGWPWSRNAEVIQLEADGVPPTPSPMAAVRGRRSLALSLRGRVKLAAARKRRQPKARSATAAAAHAVIDLDGRPHPVGPASYVTMKRRWVDAWRQGNPNATFHHQTCARWGGPEWVHPKFWCPGPDHTDWLGGQGYWLDLGGERTYPFEEWVRPMVVELKETEEYARPGWRPPWLLEIGGPETAGDSLAKALQLLDVRQAFLSNRHGLRDRVKILEYWDDWCAPDFQGAPPWANAGYAIDSSQETLAAFQKLVRDERMIGSYLRVE